MGWGCGVGMWGGDGLMIGTLLQPVRRGNTSCISQQQAASDDWWLTDKTPGCTGLYMLSP